MKALKIFFRILCAAVTFVVIIFAGAFASIYIFPGDDTPIWFILLIFALAIIIATVVLLKTAKKKLTDVALSVNKPVLSTPNSITCLQPEPPVQHPTETSDSKDQTEQSAKKRQEDPKDLKNFSDILAKIPRVEVTISGQKPNRRLVSDMPEIKFTNITRRTVIEKLFPLVVIDTETTGLTPRGNDIIEVAAIKFDVDFTPVSCFTTLLKSRRPIPAASISVHHITDEMIKDKPFFSRIAQSFSSYIAGCNIVGHNLLFDLRFLFVCGATLPENVRYYDTYRLAKLTLTSPNSTRWDKDIGAPVKVEEYDVEDYKLDTLCEYYGICRDIAHRSLSDCLATAMLFEHLIEDKTA